MARIRLLIWIGYLLLPTEGGILDGLPLGRADAVALVLLIWTAAHRVRIAGAGVAAAVMVAAGIASAAIPGEPGLYARYFATAVVGSTHERSTEYRDPAYTRVDRRLDFAHGSRDFPLAFFNDHARFNFTRADQPDRRYLEFAVAWNGWLWVEPGSHTFFLKAPAAAAELAVDGSPIIRLSPASDDQTVALDLTGGWHRLHVTMSSPYRGPRVFSAGLIEHGVRQPFDSRAVRTERIDDRQRVLARVLSIVKPAADLVLLSWLSAVAALLFLRHAGELWQQRVAAARAAITIFIALATVEAMRTAWPWATRFMVMTGGDDPMTYEAYARDILLNGPLMNGGLPLFQGEPFYYQPLYPYFLAAVHYLFGEGMFGVIFLQRVLVAVTAVFLTRIAMRFRGEAIWPTALFISTAFVWWKMAPISRDLLNESIYVPLLVSWTAALVGLSLNPSAGRAATTGVLGGLAAMARSTSLLSWPIVWPALFTTFRGKARARLLATLVACSLGLFSTIAVRNWVVSHRFVPVSTEFGVTLLGGNIPPDGLAINIAARQRFYDGLGIDAYTAQTIEYAISAPGSFAANLGRKALFALGFYEPYAPGWGYSPVYIVVWVSAAFGIAIALRSSLVPRIILLLPLAIALTQYLAVVIVYPKGERLILPIHVLLLPYAIIAGEWLSHRLARIFRPAV